MAGSSDQQQVNNGAPQQESKRDLDSSPPKQQQQQQQQQDHHQHNFKTLTSDNKKSIHELYHEAQRLAKQARPIRKHTKAKSILLAAPNNIIFDLFNTIVVEVQPSYLVDFIKRDGLCNYLRVNFDEKIVKQIIGRLKREQAIDVRAGISQSNDLRDLPRGIGVAATGGHANTSGANQTGKETIIKLIYQHVMWRAQNDRVSQATALLVRLAIEDGFKRHELRADIYQDVVGNFEDWRYNKLIKLYAFGDALASDQKLLMSSTSAGDLTRWLANFIDGSEKRHNPLLLKKLASSLRDKTKNCFYITNNMGQAQQALDTQSIRCVLLVDRLNHYPAGAECLKLSKELESLVEGGRIFIIDSLNCIDFVPDPTAESCC